MHVLIRKAIVADPQSGFHGQTVDILVEDGTIRTIAPNLNVKSDTVIEAEGLHVSPGWMDVFADYCEPGYEHKETIATGLRAAAAGGFTQTMLVPNTHPTISNQSMIQYVLRTAKEYGVRLHPMGALSQNIEGKLLAEMMDMQANGAVAFTDGWQPLQNANLMLKALEYVKAFNGTVVAIPYDAALASGGWMHEGNTSTQLGMAGIPTLAETLMLHRDISLLRYTNSKLHVTGVSSAEGVAMLRAAKAEGLKITCSVTPYHLALNDEVMHGYNSIYKVMPPIRTEADRQALIAGLKDGTIDCIASHHRPQEWDAKAREFEYAADGMNVQEMAFAIAWTAMSHEIGINRMMEALCYAPRKIFNIPQPQIAIGNPAEMTIFTIGNKHTITHDNIKSASRNNPFIGKELNGKVLGIIHHYIQLNT
jgi:dihydroorotase